MEPTAQILNQNSFLFSKLIGVGMSLRSTYQNCISQNHKKGTLRKHTYSNILKILQPKKGQFSDKKV